MFTIAKSLSTALALYFSDAGPGTLHSLSFSCSVCAAFQGEVSISCKLLVEFNSIFSLLSLTSYLAIYRTGLESKLILKLKTKIKSKTQTRYPPPIALSLPFSLHIRIAIPSRRSPPSFH
jgi:hypothetical protein